MNRTVMACLIAVGLAACTSWPEEGTGGLAERRLPDDDRIAALSERFQRQRQAGGDVHAAGLVNETAHLIVRAQRNSSAGFQDDLEIDLNTISEKLAAIDVQTKKAR